MTLQGHELEGRDVAVVGGTGNVGYFLVDAFVRAGARVLVPSRSPDKIAHLKERLGPDRSANVVDVSGDVGSPEGAAALGARVRELTDGLATVAASPSSWYQTRSMLQAGFADFRRVIEASLFPHYLAAETFLPLVDPDGSYTTINGPAGFVPDPFPGTGAISVAASAQATLVRAIAKEVGGHPRVNDVVMHAYLGPDGTRNGSPLRGEEVGDFVAALASSLGAGVDGRTIHLKTSAQVEAALTGTFDTRLNGTFDE